MHWALYHQVLPLFPLMDLTYMLICLNSIFSKSRPVSPPLHLRWPAPITWSFANVELKTLTLVLRLYLNRSHYHLRMLIGIWFDIMPCKRKSGPFTLIRLGCWCPHIRLWMSLAVGGCTRLNNMLMVGLTNIKHGWLLAVSLSKRGLIIWRYLVWWLSLQWFALCSLLLSRMVGKFINWMFIMLSWMTSFRKRYTWHNHLGLLILHFYLMCVISINSCLAWNKRLELRTTGWASF